MVPMKNTAKNVASAITEHGDPDDPRKLTESLCCCCGSTVGFVIHIVTMNLLAPQPGKGWGCATCGLPNDGAIAILCKSCHGFKPRFACDGYAAECKRVPVESLSPDIFDHDLTKHLEGN